MHTTSCNQISEFGFKPRKHAKAVILLQREIGPSLDFYLKPWLKLKDTTAFDLDDSKARPLILSIGYRYLPSPDAPPE